MGFFSEEKAQVNLEYLLIIAGAVIVVTLTSLYIKSASSSVANAAKNSAPSQNA